MRLPKQWLLPLLALPSLLGGCQEYFDFSPYATTPSEQGLTRQNLERLAARTQETFVPFKFAVLSDSHFHYESLQQAVDRINQRDDLAFVLHAGDLTDNGLLQEFEWSKEVLHQLRLPYLTAIGNHDALNNGKQVYSTLYGPFDYRFEFNRVHLVVLNSNSWEFADKAPDLEWLNSTLADHSRYQHQIVLSHIQPQDERFSATFSQRYRAALEQNFVSLLISGHSHTLSYREAIMSNGLPIGYLITGSIDHHSYAVVEVQFDRLIVSWSRF